MSLAVPLVPDPTRVRVHEGLGAHWPALLQVSPLLLCVLDATAPQVPPGTSAKGAEGADIAVTCNGPVPVLRIVSASWLFEPTSWPPKSIVAERTPMIPIPPAPVNAKAPLPTLLVTVKF